ncbi:MAG: tetratricopeptide repeat protein [Bryobacteraceae bacterium]
MFFLAAIGFLLASPQANPASAAAWRELGAAMTAQGKSEAALAAFSKACELDPKDEDACYYAGRQLFSLGRYQEAVAAFETALRAAPKEKLARTHRAAALNHIALGSLDEAEKQFREAVRAGRGPDQVRADAQTDYGAFLFRQSRTGEALAALEQAVKIYPGSSRAHAELGRVLLHLGKASEAAASLERAVELDGRSPGVRLLLGRAYLALGRKAEGERQLRLGREAWDRNHGSSTVK